MCVHVVVVWGGVEGCCHAWGDQGGGGQGLVKGLVCWLDRTKLGWFFLLINQFVCMNIICFTFCGDKYDEGSQVESKNGHHLLKAFYPPEKKRQQKLTNSKRVISSPIWKILWVGRCWHLFYCDDFSQISPLFQIWEEKCACLPKLVWTGVWRTLSFFHNVQFSLFNQMMFSYIGETEHI